ncbi:hypothetical protein PHYBLDRAFT_145964 [Phycomyces blakesleeanus NRRL 1555(-)]|uniref:Uncharacterized protein n=1 Tax=Phycomyces blakesleeanus (strain ATCC 8743b / DSM 1359 / FGSC 10004 / NBRC 33097 / NRRL 1555) TaxID=763407 RepID=A0A162PGP2_PHYB8|nr:hypothetical protein PHYBLDRAFT_145964 [Phycomyces blakesleeanus NRRL 1555(-)]OAD72647.1 hypothetical protein PHYBLDRAFT_145964 [Phycomyces blakesleeanus NRRL 1555(-)]|eukprot:XP_018290687.1 hypothetical protein PHYBLDRAFT_145964 [Phycomyces blakesleeanus NRRL 1555(-)]
MAAALRIRSEPVQDQNLDIETSTSISVSELTEFPLANETITEVLEAVMEEEIEETSSDEEVTGREEEVEVTSSDKEVTGREEEVEEISTVNRGSILPIVLTVTELIIAELQADFVQTITVAEQEDLEIEAEA